MNLNFLKYLSGATLLCLSLTGCEVLGLNKSNNYVVSGSQGKSSEVTSAGAPSNNISSSANSASKSTAPLAPPKKDKVASKSDDTAVQKANVSKPVKNKKKKDKERGETSNKVTKDELMQARRESVELENGGEPTVIIAPETEKTSTEQLTVSNPMPDEFTINGEWTIYSVRNNVLTDEERPYITFDLKQKRFYGNNGCNYINGDIIVGGNAELRLDNFIATMKTCQDVPYEYLINLAVSDVRSYAVRQDGSITFLDLKDGAGKTILVLRRHNMDYLNGAWKIVKLNGKEMTGENADASIAIDITNLGVHGTSGCNRFNGKLFIDPDKRRSLQFADIATTRMMCGPDSRETELLLALESVESAHRIGPDTIVMTSPDGSDLLELVKIQQRDFMEE